MAGGIGEEDLKIASDEEATEAVIEYSRTDTGVRAKDTVSGEGLNFSEEDFLSAERGPGAPEPGVTTCPAVGLRLKYGCMPA